MEAESSIPGTAAWREAAPPPRRFAMPIPSREDIRRGIFYMISAVLVFSLINAGIKWETARYPLGEIIFLRCIFSLIPCLAVLAASGGWRLLRTRRLKEHIGRGVMQLISIVSIFAAFAVMPLANAVAITFSAPLFLTLLSIPMLGERVGRHRWAAVLVGFSACCSCWRRVTASARAWSRPAPSWRCSAPRSAPRSPLRCGA